MKDELQHIKLNIVGSYADALEVIFSTKAYISMTVTLLKGKKAPIPIVCFGQN